MNTVFFILLVRRVICVIIGFVVETILFWVVSHEPHEVDNITYEKHIADRATYLRDVVLFLCFFPLRLSG